MVEGVSFANCAFVRLIAYKIHCTPCRETAPPPQADDRRESQPLCMLKAKGAYLLSNCGIKGQADPLAISTLSTEGLPCAHLVGRGEEVAGCATGPV